MISCYSQNYVYTNSAKQKHFNYRIESKVLNKCIYNLDAFSVVRNNIYLAK